jgi:3-dehydroquinate synthase
MMTNNELRHGEAVAIGIAIDMYCARELGLISNDDFDRVIKAMETAGMSLWNNALLERNTGGELIVIDGLELFREHLGGQLTLAMPDGLGKKMDINQLSISLVERAIAVLLERSGR